MKSNLALILILLLASCAQTPHQENHSIIRQLDTLVAQKNFFKLERQVGLHQDDMSQTRKWYYEAIIHNAFNQNEACILKVDSVFHAEPQTLSDSLLVNLLYCQEDSYFKLGQYAKASATDSLMIGKYQHVLDSTHLDNIKNQLLIRNALRNIPPQYTQMQDSSVILWSRDGIGLIEIPLHTSTQEVNAIFDTRANISSITQTFAEKLHLHLLNVSYREDAGVTGATFKSSLGIADSIQIGQALIRNAVFQVMPDSILYLAPIKYQINIVLGFPIIAQLEEVRIYKDGKMIIPQKAPNQGIRNMELDGLDPIVSLTTGNDSLLLYFDSGAGSTVMYSTYYKKHQSDIERIALKQKTAFGGAGGVREKETYTLPELSLGLGGHYVKLDSVNVLTEPTSPGERMYGNLGQDFMMPFEEFTINFRYMYMKGTM